MSITIQHTKECLCIAHITALGGSAGLNFSARPLFDYGVDGDFRLVQIRDGRRAETGFSLAYQAKSTVCWLEKDGHIIYDLEAKTYNDMVSRTSEESTLLLILLCLPRQAGWWHTVDPAGTVLRNCCYWYLPPNFETVPNVGRKRIFIPVENILTPETLLNLMFWERDRRLG